MTQLQEVQRNRHRHRQIRIRIRFTVLRRSSPDFLELYTDRDVNEESGDDSHLDDSLTDEDTEERHPITETAKRGPGRPKRILTGKRGRPRKLYHTLQEEDDLISNSGETNSPEANLVNISSEVTFHQALNGPDKDDWMNAIIEEVECLIKNDTWQIVNRPKDQNVIGCRMVLRNKYDSDGRVERRKARLVARGFTQRPGIDYHDTFAPVARLGSMRLLLALAVKHNLKVRQMDITTAYLHGTVEEETYMELPELLRECLEKIIRKRGNGSIRSRAKEMLNQIRDDGKVCHLQKALYGLKQASRQWYLKLNEKLRELDLRPTCADPCVYYSKRGGDPLLVLIYVDDILIFYRNEKDLNVIRKGLLQEFEVKDLGAARYCLGIEISRNRDQITLSQSGYVRKLLSRFRMEDCNPVGTPVESGKKLEKDINEVKGTKPYQELIGALNYLATATRPDIAHIVSCLSQFNTCHGEQHWSAAKRVLRYLKGTINFGLTYSKNSGSLEGFVDADWAGCPVDRRSYTGFVFKLNGAAISWESRKQRTVALSSTEAEYMALTEAAKEAIYIRGFMSELGFSDPEKMQLSCDNRGAQFLARNHIFHARSKHIDVRHHFVRDILREGQLEIKFLPSERMPADLLTKGLTKDKHYKCLDLVGINKLTEDRVGTTVEGEC